MDWRTMLRAIPIPSFRSVLVLAVAGCLLSAGPAAAQQAAEPVPAPDATAAPATETPPQFNTTVVPRAPAEAANPTATPQAANGQVQLVALLTADGQRIDQGVVWRVFRDGPQTDRKSSLLSTHRDASPVLNLNPGDYVVNLAFGRAHLTRKIKVAANTATPAIEQFVLNAGGLRVSAVSSGKPAATGSVSYSIYTDRDQTDNRKIILSGAKPGLIFRLNAGIYHVVSTLGDANATVRSDVTVEAGKLTEATLTHTSAKVSFKLVDRAGGEAIPETQWSIQTPQGDVVKESVGALRSHTLAPGTYTVIAKSKGKAFRKDFAVRDGEAVQVEVLLQ